MPQPAVSPFDTEGGSEALTPLQAHYRGHLRAVWAGEDDQAQYHAAEIDRIEHGQPGVD